MPPHISIHSKDILLKRVTDALRHDLLARYGVRLPPIVSRLPADLPIVEIRASAADLLFLLADGSILHIEFQTTKKPADMKRTRPLEEALREAARVAQTLPRPEKEETVGAMVGMAYHYLDEAEAVSLLEVLKMTNVLDEVINESVEKGLTQGMAQGMAQGELEGMRKALRANLETRFGAIPEALAKQIAEADSAGLIALVRRAAVTTHIEAM